MIPDSQLPTLRRTYRIGLASVFGIDPRRLQVGTSRSEDGVVQIRTLLDGEVAPELWQTFMREMEVNLHHLAAEHRLANLHRASSQARVNALLPWQRRIYQMVLDASKAGGR